MNIVLLVLTSGLQELDRDVTDASEVGKAARLAAEKLLKKPVVSKQNYLKTNKRKIIDASRSPLLNQQRIPFFDTEETDSSTP